MKPSEVLLVKGPDINHFMIEIGNKTLHDGDIEMIECHINDPISCIVISHNSVYFYDVLTMTEVVDKWSKGNTVTFYISPNKRILNRINQ